MHPDRLDVDELAADRPAVQNVQGLVVGIDRAVLLRPHMDLALDEPGVARAVWGATRFARHRDAKPD